jgi:hypothetical protein
MPSAVPGGDWEVWTPGDERSAHENGMMAENGRKPLSMLPIYVRSHEFWDARRRILVSSGSIARRRIADPSAVPCGSLLHEFIIGSEPVVRWAVHVPVGTSLADPDRCAKQPSFVVTRLTA